MTYNQSNRITSNDNYYSDYGAEADWDSSDSASWEEAWGETETLEPTPDYAEQLHRLEVQIEKSPMTPEQQKQELEHLDALEDLVKNFSGEIPEDLAYRIEETQEQFFDKLSHLDQWQASEQFLDGLEQGLEAAKDLPESDRETYRQELQKARENLQEDPSLDVREMLEPLSQALQGLETRQAALAGEAERGKDIGQTLAGVMDQKYALAPEKHADYESSHSRPRSELTHLPKNLQDYDLIMKGESGLRGSRAPGEIMRDIYETKAGETDPLSSVKSRLQGLPLGTQALLVADVLKEISQRDPQKLSFLKEHQPELLKYFKDTLAAGNDHILNGMLVTSGGESYDVEYAGSYYHIKNQDTAWYRDDWNEFDISIPSLIEPIQNSNRILEDLLGGATSTQTPA